MSGFFRKAAGRNLVVMPGSPEKLLLAQPTLADLQQRFPRKPLDIMVPTRLSGLAERFPQVDQIYNLPDPQMSWKTFWRAGLEMQGKDHGHAWVLPDRFKPALIPMLANIGERTGYRGRYRYSLLIDIRLPNPRRHPHPVDRYRALAWDIVDELAPPQPLKLTSRPEQQQAVATEFGIPDDKPLLMVCPGSLRVSAAARRAQPSADQWSELLEKLAGQGWQICLLASRYELLEVEQLLSSLPPVLADQVINLAGKVTWEEAVDLVSQARAALALDNAQALLALGCGLPVYLPLNNQEVQEFQQWQAPYLGAKPTPLSELEQLLGANL
ncbi:lipopolysaccharide heptosyltransferase II [Marinospirillum perlucidum]|uniref:lipopolysaccharide heptosyltransferase II n=1 Tax=Marinospirillum perlucidum TaxID=1982602 RepID=UPI000DF1EC6C|nr:lipopolysaccharide heptosyltransferase II [Marinospirillum perlucidum]